MNPRLLLLPLAIAALGCQNGAKKAEAPAPQPYKFPHQMHIESGVACAECHAPILKASVLKENVVDVALPLKNELCLGCHDPVPDYKPVQRFAPVVRFDHSAHLPRLKGVKDECLVCHSKIAEPGTFKVLTPPMSVCTDCHNHKQDYAVGRCTPCHRDLKAYEKPLQNYSHEAAWLETHGKWAKASVNTCTACHDQTMCSQCHTATTRPMPPSVQFPEKVTAEFIHRGDWISRHAIEQQADPTSCTKCHGTGYCQSCHAFQNVAPGGSANSLRPHPQGWISIHGQAARQNILSCAACHNQGAQSICVACHSTGRVNPHPPGWKGTRAQIGGNSMCLICHTT
ncbi:MAG: cytochrome c3 family protein [Deltaproteobacteria bacterium]